MHLSKAIALIAIALSGCASAPPRAIDLSQSIYRVSTESVASRKAVSRIEIRNTADDGKLINTMLGSDTFSPIKPATTTKQTVESDLHSFFSLALRPDAASTRSLVITISKADSYWVWGGVAKVPFFGLLVVGADTEIGMNIKVLFEVEEGGKVISTYLFDEKISIQDQASTGDAIAVSYQRLIATYRKKFFDELDARFVSRYF